MTQRRVRSIRFERRSALPVSAACMIASGVREALAPVLGGPVRLRLFPPALPSPQAWAAIVRDAHLYRVRGPAAAAAIVLRPGDGATMAAAAFGERDVRERSLSPMEQTALDRIAHIIAGQLAPVCGQGAYAVERVSRAPSLVTYFEVQVDAPVRARIGIGLERDPEPTPALGTGADIEEVTLILAARAEIGDVTAAALAELRPGDLLRFAPGPPRASLRIAGRVIGYGECGVSGNRFALSITMMSQGSTAR